MALPDKGQTFLWSRPVAHDIPEAYDLIDLLLLDVVQNGFESIDVGVNVRDESDAGHGRRLHPMPRQHVSSKCNPPAQVIAFF